MVEAFEDFGLVGEPRGGCVVDRYLEHALGRGRGGVCNEQADRSGTSTQSPDELKAAATEQVAGTGLERVDVRLGGRLRRLLGVGQLLEERSEVRCPLAGGGTGRVEDERAEGLRSGGQLGADVEPVTFIGRSSPEDLVAGPGMAVLPCHR
nr:hypothetical protein GCM10023233_17200 [Brevibacterium otitidis]